MYLRRSVLFFLSLCWSLTGSCEDLRQVYDLALVCDPTVQAAYASLQATRQQVPSAFAQMGPNLSGFYTTTGTNDSLPSVGSYNSRTYNLTLNQPLYHPEHWAQLEQARHNVKSATAAYLSATQDLIIRVATQYFNILSAQDDLAFEQAQRKAFKRELEQSQQRFDVGLIAITDVQDAKARYDTATANAIAAQNAVYDEYEKLREITGQPIECIVPFPVSKELHLLTPIPNNQEAWVDTSQEFNLNVKAAKENAEQYKSAIGTQVAAHFPKFDLQGVLQRNKSSPFFVDSQLNFSRSLTLNITVPLFASGAVIYKTREASALYQEALKRWEREQRIADSNTRQAFRGVLTAISSTKAFSQVVISNRTALESTRASYEVGTRTIVDLLNAESNLLNAQREHAQARYDYIIEGLKLKQAAGILAAEDILAVNDIICQ